MSRYARLDAEGVLHHIICHEASSEDRSSVHNTVKDGFVDRATYVSIR